MFKGARKYWLIAIICGLVGSFLFYNYMQELKSRYLPDDLIGVVQARTAISSDTIITAEQVEEKQLPAKYVHPDAVAEAKTAIGKITTTEIAAGEAVLKQNLLSAEDKAKRLAYTIPEAKRAVSIPINNVSGVSGFIRPGDKVDIIATVDVSSQGTEKTGFSVLILQDIEILAIGLDPDIIDPSDNSVGKTITLAVSIHEAQPLVLASERGSLRLLLRSPVDKSKTNLLPYQLKDFLN